MEANCMILLLLPPYLLFAIWIILSATRDIKSKSKKTSVTVILIFLLYLPLGWDVILGRIYFQYLCDAEGGMHIYQTIELDAKHWDEDGTPKFFTEDGWFDAAALGMKYSFMRDTEDAKYFNISKHTKIILDNSSGKVLADNVAFNYVSGWFIKYTGFHPTGDLSCYYYLDAPKSKRAFPGAYLYYGFMQNVFKLEEK
jgi:hypothetical protein